MSEAKFTDGEWSVQFTDMIFTSNRENKEQVAVAIVHNEKNADKYLMAASKQMYAMLEQISEFKKQIDEGINVHGGMAGMLGSIDMIDDLLAQARGES
ncbi:TPA: hypothetical protein ACGF3W_000270 [Vibrio cholerae]